MTPTDIQLQKKQLRKELRDLKNKISQEYIYKESEIVLGKLEKNRHFIESEHVMLFWSMADEIFTHDFILKWSHEKKILLPSIQGDDLIIKEFSGIKNLIQGERYQIPEPSGEIFSAVEKIDLIVVPGVAFDKKNNRMGRGKAFYDKFLQKLKVYKIGICFGFQFFDQVPVDEFDIKMDEVITNSAKFA